jgi:hypothetical protein
VKQISKNRQTEDDLQINFPIFEKWAEAEDDEPIREPDVEVG